MALLKSIATLLLFQLAGELLHTLFHLPLPGPVLGMSLLTLWLLRSRRELSPMLVRTADGLLSVLGLLFVPAGVGIVANLALIRAAWLPLSVSLVVSTLLTLIVTAVVLDSLLKRQNREQAR